MTTGNTYMLLLAFLVTRFCLTLLWPPWSVARQAPLSMRFPGQEYWSGLLGCHFLQSANVICPLSFAYQMEPIVPQGPQRGCVSESQCLKWRQLFRHWLSLVSLCGTSLVAQMVKNLPVMQKTWVQSWAMKSPWEREWLPSPVFLPEEFRGQRSLAGHSPFILLNVHTLNQEGTAQALYDCLGMTASLHLSGKLSPSVACQGYGMLAFTVT